MRVFEVHRSKSKESLRSLVINKYFYEDSSGCSALESDRTMDWDLQGYLAHKKTPTP